MSHDERRRLLTLLPPADEASVMFTIDERTADEMVMVHRLRETHMSIMETLRSNVDIEPELSMLLNHAVADIACVLIKYPNYTPEQYAELGRYGLTQAEREDAVRRFDDEFSPPDAT